MNFDKIDKETELKPVKETLGETIDVKKIIEDALKEKSKKKESRMKYFSKRIDVKWDTVKTNKELYNSLSKLVDSIDKSEADATAELIGQNSALMKQLQNAKAVTGERENLAALIAKNAGIDDENEKKRIAAALADISQKYDGTYHLG